jgi:hypothetical protein
MPKTDVDDIRELRREVAQLRALVEALRAGTVTAEAKIAVTGPRRAGALVDSWAIELPGEGHQSGKRVIDLEPPTIAVDLGVKGRSGTKVSFVLEINGKKKSEEFWMDREVEHRRFTYDFKDFGL